MTLLAGLCTPNLVGLARMNCQLAMQVYDFITYYRIAGNVCEELKFAVYKFGRNLQTLYPLNFCVQ